MSSPDATIATKGGLELHPLSALFPAMTGAEFNALKADIQVHGLHEPIVLLEGAILDGAHRYRACIEIGVEPTTVEFTGGDPVPFVLSANLHRRHLSPGQQATIVASAQDWTKAHPSHRAKEGCNVAPLATVSDRAATSGASHRTQQMADKVAKTSPELAKQVAHGEVSLPEAIKQITHAHAGPQTSAHDRAPDAEPAGKPEVTPSPTESGSSASLDEDALGDFDALAELEVERNENARLREQVAALSVDDVTAKLANEIKIRQGVEARLAQEMNKVAQLDKELRHFGKMTKALRDLLGVETNSKIVGAVRAALAAPKDKVA